MVKIVIAGGSGSGLSHPIYLTYSVANILIDVALEVIDALVAAKKHQILLLSRKVRLSHLSIGRLV